MILLEASEYLFKINTIIDKLELAKIKQNMIKYDQYLHSIQLQQEQTNINQQNINITLETKLNERKFNIAVAGKYDLRILKNYHVIYNDYLQVLYNMNNTCFINALFQLIRNVSSRVRLIIERGIPKDYQKISLFLRKYTKNEATDKHISNCFEQLIDFRFVEASSRSNYGSIAMGDPVELFSNLIQSKIFNNPLFELTLRTIHQYDCPRGPDYLSITNEDQYFLNYSIPDKHFINIIRGEEFNTSEIQALCPKCNFTHRCVVKYRLLIKDIHFFRVFFINVIRGNNDGTVNNKEVSLPNEFLLRDVNNFSLRFKLFGSIRLIGKTVGTGHYVYDQFLSPDLKLICNDSALSLISKSPTNYNSTEDVMICYLAY